MKLQLSNTYTTRCLLKLRSSYLGAIFHAVARGSTTSSSTCMQPDCELSTLLNLPGEKSDSRSYPCPDRHTVQDTSPVQTHRYRSGNTGPQRFPLPPQAQLQLSASYLVLVWSWQPNRGGWYLNAASIAALGINCSCKGRDQVFDCLFREDNGRKCDMLSRLGRQYEHLSASPAQVTTIGTLTTSIRFSLTIIQSPPKNNDQKSMSVSGDTHMGADTIGVRIPRYHEAPSTPSCTVACIFAVKSLFATCIRRTRQLQLLVEIDNATQWRLRLRKFVHLQAGKRHGGK